MIARTHQTAVVLVPPEECWEPIQAIRRQHDRQVRRWMPHVTLVYPFRPREQFNALIEVLGDACRRIVPFELHLAEFRHFHHGHGCYTLWLALEPREPVMRLQSALASVVPDCDDASRRPGGFAPHLSVGQVAGDEAMVRLKADLQAGWQPLSFLVRAVSLIWRNPRPDDVFRVDRCIALGG